MEKNDNIKPPTSSIIVNRKLLNKQSKNLSVSGFDNEDNISVDEFSTTIITTKNISTQTVNVGGGCGVGVVEKTERPIIIRPKTAKINR